VAEAATQPAVLVIGIGNALRHDDCVGLEVARRVRERAATSGIVVREHEGEAIGLLEIWDGADAVVLVDAVHSGAAPGTIHRIDASSAPVPAQLAGAHSTHAIGIGEAIELARVLERLPRQVIVYGIEGQRFEAGSGLSEAVAAAVAQLADSTLGEARALAEQGIS
jgi:hydrogenase maturation protease